MATTLLLRNTVQCPPPSSSLSSSSLSSPSILPKMQFVFSCFLMLSSLSIPSAECALCRNQLERHSIQDNGGSGGRRYLNLMAFMPFTSKGGTVPVKYYRDTSSRRRVEGNLGYSHMAAALLAMRHFNNRNPRVVPELSFLQDCPYYFDIDNSTMIDSQGRQEAALGAILDYAYSQEKQQQQQQQENQDGFYNCPDAIVDGYYFQEAPTLQLGTLANSLQLPFVSSGGFDLNLIASTATARSMSTSSTSTTTKSTTAANLLIPQQSSRVYADVFALAEAVIQYLHYIGRADYVGLLHSIGPTSVQIHEAIQTLAVTDDRNDTTTPTTMSIPHLYSMDYVPESFFGIQRTVTSTLQTFLKTGYRTIVVILDDYLTELPLIAKAAKELNMNRTDYVWILTGNFDVEYFLFWIEMVSDADIAELLLGVAAIQPLEGFIHHDQKTHAYKQHGGETTTTTTTTVNKDRFYQAWSEQGQEFIELVQSKNPISNENQVGFFQAPDSTFFQSMGPGVGSGFMYDAVIATGLGFCAAAQSAAKGLTTENHSTTNNETSSGTTTVTRGIQSSSFEGATGWVSFDVNGILPGRRVGHSVSFAAYNIRLPTTEDDLQVIQVTDILEGTTKEDQAKLGVLNHRTWKSVRPFVYADGTMTSPTLLRAIPPQNYLTKVSRIWGLVLVAVSGLLHLSAFVWLYIYRDHTVLKTGHSEYLGLVLVGSILFTTCIIPNTLDESSDASARNVEHLSRSCNVTPWLIAIGFMLIYSGLSLKLDRAQQGWRVVEATETTTRSNWTILRSIIPSTTFLFFGMVLGLMTAWSVIAGFEWQRDELDELTGESAGACRGTNTHYWFIPIVVLMTIPILLTGKQAWHINTRNVNATTTFTEAKWVVILIVSQFQLLMISIPLVLLIDDMNPSVRFVGQSSIFAVFSLTTVTLLLGPKLYEVHFTEVPVDGRASVRTRALAFGGVGTLVTGISTRFLSLSSPIFPSANSSATSSTQDATKLTPTTTSATTTTVSSSLPTSTSGGLQPLSAVSEMVDEEGDEESYSNHQGDKSYDNDNEHKDVPVSDTLFPVTDGLAVNTERLYSADLEEDAIETENHQSPAGSANEL